MDEREVPSLAEIHVAASHLRSMSLPVTPILTSSTLNRQTGRKVYLKCENFQRTGSFKSRGALNAVLNAVKVDPNVKGFVTHSSGNHGQALAYAASIVERPCVVVVPRGTPKNKTDAIERYGAELVVCEPTPASRTATSAQISQERDFLMIPPFDHRDVIAGKRPTDTLGCIPNASFRTRNDRGGTARASPRSRRDSGSGQRRWTDQWHCAVRKTDQSEDSHLRVRTRRQDAWRMLKRRETPVA